jgi:hypothetical protein
MLRSKRAEGERGQRYGVERGQRYGVMFGGGVALLVSLYVTPTSLHSYERKREKKEEEVCGN